MVDTFEVIKPFVMNSISCLMQCWQREAKNLFFALVPLNKFSLND